MAARKVREFRWTASPSQARSLVRFAAAAQLSRKGRRRISCWSALQRRVRRDLPLSPGYPGWPEASSAAWPCSTLAANVIGGRLMGMLVGVLAYRGGADLGEVAAAARRRRPWRLHHLFGAFSLETALMIERRTYVAAASYTLISVVLSVAALFAGLLLTRRLFA